MDIAAVEGGLICGYQLAPPRALGGDLASLPAPDDARPYWLHFSLADARVERWLRDMSGLPADAVDALVEPDPRAHGQVIGEGVVMVLCDLHHSLERKAATAPAENPGAAEGFGKFRVYVDERRMITLRGTPLRTADRLRRELATGSTPGTTAALFGHYLGRLAETVGALVAGLSDVVDDAEDEVLAGRYRRQATVLGKLRRDTARLRRHINANHGALALLRGHLPAPLREEQPDLLDALGSLETIAQDLDLVQERTRLLQDEIAGRLSEATNRNLEVLSLVTTALLPITLVTGVFGMNVGGLPGVNDPHGFRWVMSLIVGAIAVVLVWLLRRRGQQ